MLGINKSNYNKPHHQTIMINKIITFIKKHTNLLLIGLCVLFLFLWLSSPKPAISAKDYLKMHQDLARQVLHANETQIQYLEKVVEANNRLISNLNTSLDSIQAVNAKNDAALSYKINQLNTIKNAPLPTYTNTTDSVLLNRLQPNN
jgi:hypothetical protein